MQTAGLHSGHRPGAGVFLITLSPYSAKVTAREGACLCIDSLFLISGIILHCSTMINELPDLFLVEA